MKTNKPKAVPKLRFSEFKGDRDWEVKELGTVATFSKGKGLPKSYIDNKGTLPCIHYGELFTRYSEVIDNIVSYTNVKENWVLSEENDVLMPTSDVTPNGLAKASCINKSGVILGGDILIIKTEKESINGEFLSRYIRFREQKVLQYVSGSTVYHLYASAINKLPLYLPRYKEQQKIADCLSSLDALIKTKTEQLNTLKDYKGGLLQQLVPAQGETIPKRRFAEFKNAEDWEEVSLIDVTNSNIKWSFIGGPFGSNLKASDYTSVGVRVIQLQNIGDGEFVEDSKIYTSVEKADELLANNIYPNDIILSKMGDPVGRACIIPDTHDRYVMCSDGIRLVVDESKHSKYFIYSLIN